MPALCITTALRVEGPTDGQTNVIKMRERFQSKCFYTHSLALYTHSLGCENREKGKKNRNRHKEGIKENYTRVDGSTRIRSKNKYVAQVEAKTCL